MSFLARTLPRASCIAVLASGLCAPAALAETTSTVEGGNGTLQVADKLWAKYGADLAPTLRTDVYGCGFLSWNSYSFMQDGGAYDEWVSEEGKSVSRFRAKAGIGNGTLRVSWKVRHHSGEGPCSRTGELLAETGPDLVHIDNTAPFRTATDSPAPARSRWHLTSEPVTATWGAADDGVGVGAAAEDSAPAPVTVSGDGVHELSADATDLLGNTGESQHWVRIDTVKPEADAVVAPQAAAAGWHRDPVTVTLGVEDATSGPYKAYYTVDGGPEHRAHADEPVDEPIEIGVEKEGVTSIVYRGDDYAGHETAPRTLEVRIDKTAPTAAATLPAPGEDGWHADEATARLTAEDGTGSGVQRIVYTAGGETRSVAGDTADVKVLGDGARTITYHAVDRVGRASEPRTVTVKVDGTDPTADATVDPQPNAAGWHREDATVTIRAQDVGGSGVEGIAWTAGEAGGSVAGAEATVPVTAEGITTVRYRAEDGAGNVGAERSLVVRLDKTAPVLGCAATPSALWPPNGKLVPVAFGVEVTDAGSGPAGFILRSASSSEPAVDAVHGFELGSADTAGLLRAERLGTGAGRTYTLTYEGRDLAGNTATCAPTVTVAHDRGR